MTLPTPSPRATRAVVADPPGQPTTLTLYDDGGALGSIALGPADAVALASDLLLAARLRFGRTDIQSNNQPAAVGSSEAA